MAQDLNVIQQLAGLALRVLGRFEKPLIQAIDHLGENASCSQLTKHLSEKLGREISLGQTTRSLSALTEMGLITAAWVKPSEGGFSHRSRNIYSLTPAGRQVFEAAGMLPSA